MSAPLRLDQVGDVILAFWRSGYDTAEIAKFIRRQDGYAPSEASVEKVLHVMLDARRAAPC